MREIPTLLEFAEWYLDQPEEERTDYRARLESLLAAAVQGKRMRLRAGDTGVLSPDPAQTFRFTIDTMRQE